MLSICFIFCIIRWVTRSDRSLFCFRQSYMKYIERQFRKPSNGAPYKLKQFWINSYRTTYELFQSWMKSYALRYWFNPFWITTYCMKCDVIHIWLKPYAVKYDSTQICVPLYCIQYDLKQFCIASDCTPYFPFPFCIKKESRDTDLKPNGNKPASREDVRKPFSPDRDRGIRGLASADACEFGRVHVGAIFFATTKGAHKGNARQAITAASTRSASLRVRARS